ncbi:MAG: AIR synthase related protein [Actinobacteria bacterium]|nr:AIR synthase related protein [Actinomycetota bacterium]
MAISDGGFNEAQVIARLKEIFASTDPRISLGIGDDAAVVSGAKAQVLTTDMAVSGVHFRTEWSSAFEIGRKVTAANTADLLAMSAKPDYLLVAVALTGSETMEWISDLARGIKYEADLAGAHVVGGDISRADQVVISMTAIGSTNKAITRSGAKPGDGIYLSSLTGWSAAGLAILSSGSKEDMESAQKALSEFKSPTIDYGFDASKANALCDVSDALVIQAAQMAEASKVCFNFDLTKIQASAEFMELENLAQRMDIDIWSWIFAGRGSRPSGNRHRSARAFNWRSYPRRGPCKRSRRRGSERLATFLKRPVDFYAAISIFFIFLNT